VFIESPEIAEYLDVAISGFKKDAKRIKLAINYLLNDMTDSAMRSIQANLFAETIELITNGDISSRGAKDLLVILTKQSSTSQEKMTVKATAEANGLMQKSAASDLIPTIEKVIADNSKVVTEYKGGKIASLQFLIGQAMKATKGAGNPEVVKKLLIEKLSNL
jgi:aspartyl-tRNA(Asn)/glutamyl-tRNA(Gln) amidotransferase subunit B